MIETEQSIVIDAPIEAVWDYAQDIRKWASIFPGCKGCEVIDDNNSHWILKVGAGGLVRTVNVQVHVDQWDGPERVNFSYQLEAEPVVGSGSYIASRQGDNETAITLKVIVEGSGPVAPMWEAVSTPLLPALAKIFAKKLKAAIEELDPKSASKTAAVTGSTSLLATIGNWLQKLWCAITGSKSK